MKLIGEAAKALIESDTEAGVFVGGALRRWLEIGGSLEAVYLKVIQRGSHRTARRIWAGLIADERQDAEAVPTLRPSSSKASRK